MSEIIIISKVYESFVLGFCQCGCNEEIHIRTTGKVLCLYKKGHYLKKNKPSWWKGGRIKLGDYWMLSGYYDHPNSDKHDRILEHIYNFTMFNKCCMLPWGVVHHKDPVREGWCLNLPWNLEGMTRGNHETYHNKNTRIYNLKDTSGIFCSDCGSNETYKKEYGGYDWRSDNKGGWRCSRCRGLKYYYENK